jgi:hypothetical protein
MTARVTEQDGGQVHRNKIMATLNKNKKTAASLAETRYRLFEGQTVMVN